VVPDPAVLLATLGAAALFVRGWRRDPAATVGALTRAGLGLVAVLVALAPWLERLAVGSFAWHMVQHQLLVLVAAPLLASAGPVRALRAAGGRPLPRLRSRLVVPLTLAVALTHALVVVGWHLPPLYDAAMRDERVHQLEHLTLLAVATLAWGAVVVASRADGARPLAAVVGLAVNALVGAGLGVVLLSAPVPLYEAYAPMAGAVVDQQVGGAAMKVGAVLVYAGAAAGIGARWLRRMEGQPAAATRLSTTGTGP
jgi:putative membrane protein